MKYSGFEKNVIYNVLNGHRQFNMYENDNRFWSYART